MPRRRILTIASAAAVSAALLFAAGCGGSKVGEDTGSDTSADSCVDTSGDTIKVGFVNSLSGTMAISEKTVSDGGRGDQQRWWRT